MDVIKIIKAVLEFAGGLVLIGVYIAISVNVEIVIHFGKPRKTRKSQHNSREFSRLRRRRDESVRLENKMKDGQILSLSVFFDQKVLSAKTKRH